MIALAWPIILVDEAYLKLLFSALGLALGDGQGGHRYVVTVTGRGYGFVRRPGEPGAEAPGIAAADDRAGGDERAIYNLPYCRSRG